MAGLSTLISKLQAEPTISKPVLWDPGNIRVNIETEQPTGTSTWDLSGDPGSMEDLYTQMTRISGTMSFLENDPYQGGMGVDLTQFNLKKSIAEAQGADLALKVSPFGANNQNASYSIAGLDSLYDDTGYVAQALETMYDRYYYFQNEDIKYIWPTWEGYSSLTYSDGENEVRLLRYQLADQVFRDIWPNAKILWYLGAPHSFYWRYGLWNQSGIGRYGIDNKWDDIGDYYNFECYRPWSLAYITNIWRSAQRLCKERNRRGWMTSTIMYSRYAPSHKDNFGLAWWQDGGDDARHDPDDWAHNGTEYASFNDFQMGQLFGQWDNLYNYQTAASNANEPLDDAIDGMFIYAFPFRQNAENDTYYLEWFLRFLTMCRGARDSTTSGFDDIDNWDHTFTQPTSDYC